MTKRTPALILAAAALLLTLTGCVEPPVDIPATAAAGPNTLTAAQPTPAPERTENPSEALTEADKTNCATVRDSIIKFNASNSPSISKEGRLNNLTQLSETLNNENITFIDATLTDTVDTLKSAVSNYYAVTLNSQTVNPTVITNNTENAELYYQNASTQTLLNCN